VIFRVFKTEGDVIAFLLDAPANPGHVLSYQHIGQHGEAQYGHCLTVTRPATEAEAAPLLAELRRVGYDDLHVVKRFARR
jgi:hypothetical protein